LPTSNAPLPWRTASRIDGRGDGRGPAFHPEPESVWLCPTKATDSKHSDRKVPRRGSGNDPRHGGPCVCAGGGFCRGIDAVPWRRQQSLAGQGNQGVAGGAALAAPTKEDAETFTDPFAQFQGRGGARSLEAGHHRPFPAPQALSDLSVVGRSWAEVAR